ncbi:hypothetical protein ACWCSD_30400, partial [Nonomuraea sp. NPDC001684]
MKTLFRTAVTAAALAMATTACTSAATGQAPVPKVTLDAVRLVAYDSCDDMLSGLREHAAE